MLYYVFFFYEYLFDLFTVFAPGLGWLSEAFYEEISRDLYTMT